MSAMTGPGTAVLLPRAEIEPVPQSSAVEGVMAALAQNERFGEDSDLLHREYLMASLGDMDRELDKELAALDGAITGAEADRAVRRQDISERRGALTFLAARIRTIEEFGTAYRKVRLTFDLGGGPEPINSTVRVSSERHSDGAFIVDDTAYFENSLGEVSANHYNSTTKALELWGTRPPVLLDMAGDLLTRVLSRDHRSHYDRARSAVYRTELRQELRDMETSAPTYPTGRPKHQGLVDAILHRIRNS